MERENCTAQYRIDSNKTHMVTCSALSYLSFVSNKQHKTCTSVWAQLFENSTFVFIIVLLDKIWNYYIIKNCRINRVRSTSMKTDLEMVKSYPYSLNISRRKNNKIFLGNSSALALFSFVQFKYWRRRKKMTHYI